MKSEDEPIEPDEFVLRLIWRDFCKRGEPPIIRPRAFRPKPNETDGISVFREACVSRPEDILAVIDEDKRDKYGIVRIPVAELIALDLSLVSAKIETVSGHAVIPELSIVAFDADPKELETILEVLAVIARANVIRKPSN